MKTQTLNLYLSATIWMCISISSATQIVQIKNGTLEGSLMKSRNERGFRAFKGIPYALPPIGNLRFEAPRPAVAWSGLRSAKEDGAICLQQIYHKSEKIESSENCLFLNVYTPQLSTDRLENSSFPVMIFFHGGANLGGSGHSDLYGPTHLLDHDVVLVSVNYRLGSLGFLSTEDMVSPGNQGMKDQVQSIRWVRENIDAFGGDPNSITIFGESSGAASVHSHILSPLSKGLFHRGISQSGTTFNPWAIMRPGVAKKNAQILAQSLNCPTSNSHELIDCLRSKNGSDLININSILYISHPDPIMPFRIVIEPQHDGAFFTHDPVESLKSRNNSDVPWLTGLTSHEGALKVIGLFKNSADSGLKKLKEEWTKFLPLSLLYNQICSKHHLENISNEIREFYFANETIDVSSKFKLIDMYSDYWFNLGTHDAVKNHMQTFNSPVYYYYFSYKGSISFSQVYRVMEDYGVTHAEDLLYIFPLSKTLFPPGIERKEEDEKMIDILTTFWYNFAKTGNPTPRDAEKLKTKWAPVKTEALEYLAIESPTNLTMSKNLNSVRMAFWHRILNQYCSG